MDSVGSGHGFDFSGVEIYHCENNNDIHSCCDDYGYVDDESDNET
jgi:hypothetical protein